MSAPAEPPRVIGAAFGVAVPVDVPCGIVRRDDDEGEYTDHEQFNLGAFDDTLEHGGQELWVNHIRPALRGRFSRLAVDARELRFRFELHDGPREHTLLQRIKAGDIWACSIGYRYRSEYVRCGGVGGTTRVLTAVQLDEISLLDGGRPAWYGTWVRAE